MTHLHHRGGVGAIGKIRGVNLGGWLVLEKWMKPSLFRGLNAVDETTFCTELGTKAESRLREHWETWITDSDFRWIANAGLNSVRIPVGHWIFGDTPPYCGSIDILDWAMKTADEYNLAVLLDLHAAPGCQNGFDNGGIQGVMDWHRDPDNIERSLDVIERLADRYKDHRSLLGIQLLNEPRWDVPMDIIKDYYLRGYCRIRRVLGDEKIVAIHDGFRALEWDGFMSGEEYRNVLLDTHMYQCFTEEDRNTDIFGHVQRGTLHRKQELDRIGAQLPTIVGEWSLGLNPKSLEGLNNFQLEHAFRAYGAGQLLAYEQSAGWYFWSYKIEQGTAPHWNFRECVERGWLPEKYDIA